MRDDNRLAVIPVAPPPWTPGKKRNTLYVSSYAVRTITSSGTYSTIWILRSVCVGNPPKGIIPMPRAGPALSCYEKIYHRLFLPGDETNHHSKSKISTTTTTTLCYWNGNKDEISALSERYESVMEKRRRVNRQFLRFIRFNMH